jgi:uncharacterized membrane protein YccC
MPSTQPKLINWLWKHFQIKPGKPAIAPGLRTALALCVPLGLGLFTNHISWGTTIALAALYVSIADVGGAYRHRAIVLVAATIGVAVAMPLAGVVGHVSWLAMGMTFLWVFVAGLTGLYGNSATTVGFVTSLMFVVSIAVPSPPTSIERFALCLVGGIWTMILSLGLWVVNPYKPVQQAVAKCYIDLAALIEQAGQINSNHKSWQQQLQEIALIQDTLTQNLETARSVWSAVRSERLGASSRGIELLVLLEDASLMMTSVVALTEMLEVLADNPQFTQIEVEIQQAMQQLAIAMKILAHAIAKGGDVVLLPELDQAIVNLVICWESMHKQVLDHTEAYYELVNIRKIVSNTQAIADKLFTDAEVVTQLQCHRQISVTQPDTSGLTVWNRTSILNTLGDNLTFHSTGLRHALRLGLTAAIAVGVADLLNIPKSNWVAMTVLIILKPNFGGTFKTAVQRVGGTVLGAGVAMILASLMSNHWLLLASMFILTAVAFAVKPLNYGLYVFVLTPLIILLLNVTHASNWEIGLVRILDTLIGGGLALIGGYLFFPSWERQRLPAQLAKTIKADLTYFQQVMAIYLDSTQNIGSISILRHRAALENANATASVQRLLSEPHHVRGVVEPAMTLIVYTRSFFNSITTLTEHLQEFSGQHPLPGLQLFTDAIIQILENLIDVLQQELPLQPLPNLDVLLVEIHDHIQQLHNTRIAELGKYANHLTPALQAVRDKTIISTELDRITNEISIMYYAIARFQLGNHPTASR